MSTTTTIRAPRLSTIRRFYNHTFDIIDVGHGEDGQGGYDELPRKIATAINGHLRPVPSVPVEWTSADQRQGKVFYTLYCDADVSILRNNILVVTLQGVSPKTITVKVVGVRMPGGIPHHLEVDCYEIQEVSY